MHLKFRNKSGLNLLLNVHWEKPAPLKVPSEVVLRAQEIASLRLGFLVAKQLRVADMIFSD